MSAVAAVGVPIAHSVAVHVPEVLITAESQSSAPRPDGFQVHLANVDAEAAAIQAAFGGATKAEVQRNISISELDRFLAGRTTWCFPGHGDAMLQSEPTLAFVGVGDAMEVVSIDTLVGLVRPHVLTGKLKLIVLTGCCTARLAAALRERAFVPYVVCWETLLNDEAGRIFGTAFAQAIADGAEPPAAFEKARTAVCTETEPGNLDNRLSARVQKFELDIDPNDVNLVHPMPPPGQPRTIHDGRLRHHPGAPRGRLAAGTPKLLRFESTPLHDVPSLPAHYMPRPEQSDLRAALVNGVRGDNTVTGIAGTAGLGKTTTANWLALDPCVRSAFRDGVFWLEFGKERTAMQRLVRLAQLLGVPLEDLDRLERRGMDLLRDEVARRLKDRCCLIILDDVWDKQQPKPFQKLVGGRVAVLMTTRKSSIVEAFGDQLARLPLRPMEDKAATNLMLQSSGKAVDELHRPSFAKLVKMCAGVPAMLRSVGRMCNTRSAEGVVEWFADHKLCHQMPTDMAEADGYQQDAAEGNLFLAYEGQLDGLAERDEELVTRCTMLAVFPEDTEVPLDILSDLWGTDVAKTRGVVERLGGEHLVELVADGARIRLLDPVRDYLCCRGKSTLEGWQARLLGTCQARQVGGEGSGYWERHDGARHFMHHLNGCNGKLGEGSLGAIEELNLCGSDVTFADAANLAAILKTTKIVSLNLDDNRLCGIDTDFHCNIHGIYTTLGITKLSEGLKGSAVTSLSLDNNMLCGVDYVTRQGTYNAEGITKLCEGLKGSCVTSLSLCCNGIRDAGASVLAAVLKETQITKLDLWESNLGPKGVADLGEGLRGNSMLQSLTLGEDQLCGGGDQLCGDVDVFTTEGITKFCEGLKGSAVTSLGLPNSSLGPEGGAALAAGLKGNSTLQLLAIGGNEIGVEGASALAAVLKETMISSLRLVGNSIGDDGASSLAAVLKETQITNLNLGGNNIGVEGASALAAVLKETKILKLDLSGNNIGPDGGAALAEGLRGNSTLQSLKLHSNMLCGIDHVTRQGTYNAEGFTKLCEVLKGSCVTSLSLYDNRIGTTGASVLAATLKETQITKLNVGDNNITGDAADHLANVVLEHAIMTNFGGIPLVSLRENSITELDLGNMCYLGVLGVIVLSKLLPSAAALTTLNLWGNNIRDEGASVLAAFLKETQITNLNIGYNRIGDEGACALAAILKETKITTLGVRENGLDDHAKQVLTYAAGNGVKIEF